MKLISLPMQASLLAQTDQYLTTTDCEIYGLCLQHEEQIHAPFSGGVLPSAGKASTSSPEQKAEEAMGTPAMPPAAAQNAAARLLTERVRSGTTLCFWRGDLPPESITLLTI